MLTTAAAKAARARSRAYKLFDEEGLHLYVAPTGRKSWRLRYRFGGREQLLTLGRFPEISLAEARARRDSARERVAAGARPRVDRQVNTLEHVARAWHAEQLDQWSPAHAADVLASLERAIFAALGETPIGAIAAAELRDALRPLERRGAAETARRLRQRLEMIFAWAIGEGLVKDNPAKEIGAALRRPRPPRPQPALVSAEDCRALLGACGRLNAPGSVVQAHRFLALTAVRLEAVRGMRWDEVDDLDGAEPLWRVPAARMKLTRAKKGEGRFDHVVPLSAPAAELLRDIANLHRGDADLHGLVFPGAAGNAPIGEGAIRALVIRAGFGTRHVPHGWRASFSTILNETLGEAWRGDIDRALAHVAAGKVEGAYNRAQQLDRRRELYERWGAMLAA